MLETSASLCIIFLKQNSSAIMCYVSCIQTLVGKFKIFCWILSDTGGKDWCMWSTSGLHACALQLVTGQTKPVSQLYNHPLLDKGGTKSRQRADKEQEKFPRCRESWPALCPSFVYSLCVLCLAKNSCWTVTWALFGLWLPAEHMCLMHLCSACISLCPQCM